VLPCIIDQSFACKEIRSIAEGYISVVLCKKEICAIEDEDCNGSKYNKRMKRIKPVYPFAPVPLRLF